MNTYFKIIIFVFILFFSNFTFGFKTDSKDFTLVQKENVSYLKYKDKIIKTYFHTSKNYPFTPLRKFEADGCVLLTKKLKEKETKISVKNLNEEELQKVRDILTLSEQNNCLKESINKQISIRKVENTRLFNIFEMTAPYSKTFLFDPLNMKLYNDFPLFGMEKVKIGKSGIYGLSSDLGSEFSYLSFIDFSDSKNKVLFKDEEGGIFRNVVDYELLANKQIKVFYNIWDEEKGDYGTKIYSDIINITNK